VNTWVGLTANMSTGLATALIRDEHDGTLIKHVYSDCPPDAVGEYSDCGWNIIHAPTGPSGSGGGPVETNWSCKPGESYTFGVWDPSDCASATPLGSARGRLHDSPLRWHGRLPERLVRVLAHNDNACGRPEPGVNFICGPSGAFTVMYRAYAGSARSIELGPGAFGAVATDDDSIAPLVQNTVVSTPDVGSSGTSATTTSSR
jgi:hypothetical protein